MNECIVCTQNGTQICCVNNCENDPCLVERNSCCCDTANDPNCDKGLMFVQLKYQRYFENK